MYLQRIFLILSLGSLSLLSSYSISVISGVLLFLEKSYGLTLLQKQQLVSTILLGALLGVSFSGVIADRYGRKAALAVGTFFYAMGALVVVNTELVDIIVWGRAVMGVGVGISSVVVPLYLAEIASKERRGACIALFQVAVTVGILISYLVNWAIASSGEWQIPFIVALILSLMAGVALFFIPESPVWLFFHHQEKKAIDAMESLDGEESVHRKRERAKKEGAVQFIDLFRKGLLSALLIAVALSIFQQATGINTVIYYAPTLFLLAGYTSISNTLMATLFIGALNVVATIGSTLWIDRFGRRKMLLIGISGMILSLVALSFSISIVALIAYLVFFAISLGPIVFVIIAEIFPMRFRGKAVSLALFINWLMNYFVSFSFLPLLEKIGYSGAYLLFAGVSFSALVFIYFFLPETKGKSFEEIQLYWKV